MGALLAKFKKEQTTEQKLEQLEEKIKKIEEYGVNTQERKKRFVGTFLAVAVGIYVIAVVSIVYFIYFPVTWKERILYFVPLLIFPYLIILLRRLFTWHFQRKLNKNSDTLTKLRAEKKEILEQVMDKETYKVAVNLLARFGDRSASNRLSLGLNQRPNLTPQINNPTITRTLAKPTMTATTTQLGVTSPLLSQTNAQNRISSLRPSNQLVATSQSLTTTPQLRTDQQMRRRTPFPIVNQAGKSIFERCLDLLIGDGPQDRFAVICRECHSHNGMALKEEFDYIAYRCAFCNAMNPARKTRPIAPRLTSQAHSDHGTPRSISRSGDSSSSTATPEASDDEDVLDHSPRRTQLRLTESTVNHSDSPEVISHDEPVAPQIVSNEVTEPSPVAQTPEPMDVVDDDHDRENDHELNHENRKNVVSEEEKKLN